MCFSRVGQKGHSLSCATSSATWLALWRLSLWLLARRGSYLELDSSQRPRDVVEQALQRRPHMRAQVRAPLWRTGKPLPGHATQ